MFVKQGLRHFFPSYAALFLQEATLLLFSQYHCRLRKEPAAFKGQLPRWGLSRY